MASIIVKYFLSLSFHHFSHYFRSFSFFSFYYLFSFYSIIFPSLFLSITFPSFLIYPFSQIHIHFFLLTFFKVFHIRCIGHSVVQRILNPFSLFLLLDLVSFEDVSKISLPFFLLVKQVFSYKNTFSYLTTTTSYALSWAVHNNL